MGAFLKYILPGTLWVCYTFTSLAQRSEIGLFLGGSIYSGDLAPTSFYPGETNFGGGFVIRYNITRHLAVRANYFYGTLSGDDANQSKENLKKRNLSFRSTLFEVSLVPEFTLIHLSTRPKKKISPYVFAGVGLYIHNPRANYNGKWYSLQPLSTEGQETSVFPNREKYKLIGKCIPAGAGIKIFLSRPWELAFETGIRKTFTDYLDDVSKTYVAREVLLAEEGELAANLSNRTGELNGGVPFGYDESRSRGNPANGDLYLFSGIMLNYNIMQTRAKAKNRKVRYNNCVKFNSRSKF